MTQPEDTPAPAWHQLPMDEALSRLHTSTEGLSVDEAARRLQQHGPNQIPAARGAGFWLRLLRQFHNALIYVLLISAVGTALLGYWLDTAVILGVVVINAIIGLVQEGKAEKALTAIRDLLAHQAVVLRGGLRRTLEASVLVPGDVVWLQAGDRVPADLRLLSAQECRIDEAILTGESVPVDKQTAPVPPERPLAERACMAYSSTMVVAGTAVGLVVATGLDTEVGRISGLLGGVRSLTTPLLRQMQGFARALSLATLVLSALLLVLGWLVRGYPLADMFLATVAFAVGAIPEGLPAILTITLAIGVQRMARRQAIIRELPAVEALGAVTVICSDKTGTLTRNQMTVTDLVTGSGRYRVTGVGYGADGEVLQGQQVQRPGDRPALDAAIRAAVLCNDAELHREGDDWHLSGDPTEGALLALGLKWGLPARQALEQNPRVDAIPFESANRYMATLHHDHHHHRVIYVKGAPERILGMASRMLGNQGPAPLEHGFWQRQAEELAASGRRVLALAMAMPGAGAEELNVDDIGQDLMLLALVGMEDPARPEAVTAVQQARAAGVRVKMITGDHATTAQAIGHDMGIGLGQQAITGAALDALDDEGFAALALSHDIFARTSPEHKLRLVRSLQAQGQVVAMTGDGVNDAPALKRADVGIAMGLKGTDAAKQASRVVLADDNFATIVAAVEEGRIVYDNLRKALLFILPTSGGEALSILRPLPWDW